VLAIFLTDSFELPDLLAAFGDVPLGREAAVQLHAAGADVVFPAAGDSGRGALLAAEEASTPDLPRWVIGVDTDWALTEEHATRVLGSVVKRLDVAMEDITRDVLAGELESGFRRSGLADGWVELSRRGGHLDPLAAELDELRDAIADGTIEVPRWPTGPVLPTPEHALVLREGELTFTGDACTYRGTRELEEGQGLAVTLVDRSGDGFTGVGYQVDDPPPLDPARSSGRSADATGLGRQRLGVRPRRRARRSHEAGRPGRGRHDRRARLPARGRRRRALPAPPRRPARGGRLIGLAPDRGGPGLSRPSRRSTSSHPGS
jgi:hypothetical protein